MDRACAVRAVSPPISAAGKAQGGRGGATERERERERERGGEREQRGEGQKEEQTWTRTAAAADVSPGVGLEARPSLWRTAAPLCRTG